MRIEDKEYSPVLTGEETDIAAAETCYRMDLLTDMLISRQVVVSYKDSKVFFPGNLEPLTLDETRLVYALSYRYTAEEIIGCIALRTPPAPFAKVFSDATELSYNYSIAQGESFWQLDFVPFGFRSKIEGLELESLYLGNLDLARFIASKMKDPSRPAVVGGSTNAHAANFAIRYWGFHLGEALVSTNGKTEEVNGERAMVAMKEELSDRKSASEGRNSEFHLFAMSDDIFTDAMVRRLDEIRERIYQRALSRGKTTAPTEGEYERRLRLLGIEVNLMLIDKGFINKKKPHPFGTDLQYPQGELEDYAGMDDEMWGYNMNRKAAQVIKNGISERLVYRIVI